MVKRKAKKEDDNYIIIYMYICMLLYMYVIIMLLYMYVIIKISLLFYVICIFYRINVSYILIDFIYS